LEGSYSIGTTDTEAVQDAALVDVDRQRVFWFARESSSTALVIETDYSCGNVKIASIGQSSATTIRAGAFDDAHYTTSTAGNLYVCGKREASDLPTLYVFAFGSSGWSTTPSVTNNNIASVAGECSPLTTFKDGTGQDRLFLGVDATDPNQDDVIQAWKLPIASNSERYEAQLGYLALYNGGAGGIIVDNRTSIVATSNIYFQTPFASAACRVEGTNRVCAVKLTQSGLH